MDRHPIAPPHSRAALPSAWAWTAAVVALAVALRGIAPLDANIAWLVSVGRAYLSGSRLYVDIVETNPPMAIFLSLPAVWIERVTDLAAGPVYAASVLGLGTATALWFSSSLQRATGLPFAPPVVLAVMLILPLAAFGEREHVALLCVLPLLGLAARRAAGWPPGLAEAVMAGCLAGLAPMVKPHFALAIAAPYVLMALRQRRPAALVAPEAVLAAALVVAYALAVWVLFPAYFTDILPLLVEVYRPMAKPLVTMLLGAKVLQWLVAFAALAFALGGSLRAPVPATLLAASAGFLVGFVDQGRGWPYHAYPALALLLLAVALSVPAVIRSASPARRMAALVAVLAALVPFATLTHFGYAGSGVVAPIRQAVTAPRVLSISFDLTPGHPITTDTDGTWVGTYSSRWITVNATHLEAATTDPERRALLDRWLAHDRAVTNRDLATRRPDIVLVGLGPFDWPGWIARDPETAALMGAYEPLARDELTPAQRERVEGVAAWIRRDRIRASPAP